MKSFSHTVSACYEDICEDECMHILASRHIIKEIDSYHEIPPEIELILIHSCTEYSSTSYTYHTRAVIVLLENSDHNKKNSYLFHSKYNS